MTGRSIPVTIGPRRPGDVACLVGQADRAKTVLGWQPHHSQLATIIETAWRWAKDFYQ
ncbi:MAG: hypothetical protein OHK0012_20010 [Synechococcales cyanobacterium]